MSEGLKIDVSLLKERFRELSKLDRKQTNALAYNIAKRGCYICGYKAKSYECYYYIKPGGIEEKICEKCYRLLLKLMRNPKKIKKLFVEEVSDG